MSTANNKNTKKNLFLGQIVFFVVVSKFSVRPKTACHNAKNGDKRHRSLQKHFYAAKTLYFLKINIIVVFGKVECTKIGVPGQAISSGVLSQIRPTLNWTMHQFSVNRR